MEGLDKVVSYFKERNIFVKALVSEQSTHDSLSASKAFGIELSQITKSMIFEADERPILILISGDRNVDVGKLKKIIGIREIKLAKPEFVLSNTGFVVGAVPPVAHRKPIQVYLDKSLFRHRVVYPAGGTRNSLFEIELGKLLEAVKGEVIDVGEQAKP